jgi:hypothetical protein
LFVGALPLRLHAENGFSSYSGGARFHNARFGHLHLRKNDRYRYLCSYDCGYSPANRALSHSHNTAGDRCLAYLCASLDTFSYITSNTPSHCYANRYTRSPCLLRACRMPGPAGGLQPRYHQWVHTGWAHACHAAICRPALWWRD